MRVRAIQASPPQTDGEKSIPGKSSPESLDYPFENLRFFSADNQGGAFELHELVPWYPAYSSILS